MAATAAAGLSFWAGVFVVAILAALFDAELPVFAVFGFGAFDADLVVFVTCKTAILCAFAIFFAGLVTASPIALEAIATWAVAVAFCLFAIPLDADLCAFAIVVFDAVQAFGIDAGFSRRAIILCGTTIAFALAIDAALACGTIAIALAGIATTCKQPAATGKQKDKQTNKQRHAHGFGSR